MGYTTDFTGKFTLDRVMSEEHAAYLNKFADTRRMQRNVKLAVKLGDPVRKAVGLPVGEQGSYFVGEDDFHGESVINGNKPPADQPGLWCQWEVTNNRKDIEWDRGEKFYGYVEWIQYIIDHFLKLWGYKLNGEVTWSGEDLDDLGAIVIVDNVVNVFNGEVTYS